MTIFAIAADVAKKIPVESTLPPWFAWVHVAADIAVSIAAALAGVQLLSTLRDQKRNRAMQYTGRFNDLAATHDLIEALKTIEDRGISETDKLTVLDNQTAVRTAVIGLLNFYEDLGLSFSKKLVDRALVREYFTTVVLRHHDNLIFYIRDLRRKETVAPEPDKIFENFVNLAVELRRKRKK